MVRESETPTFGWSTPSPDPRPEPVPVAASQRLMLSIPEAADQLGVGTTLVRRLIVEAFVTGMTDDIALRP